MENWLELWQKNYNSEGDCSQLAELVRKVGFGKKTDASYLPWAVVQRIFERQGGTLEIVYTEKDGVKNIIETEKVLYKVDMSDNDTKYYYNFCFFVNVKATWNGRTYTEKYPIQDSSSNPIISGLTQNDINKSIQRAKVKAIAIVSGIGYRLYETGDLQFDEPVEETKTTKKSEKTIKLSVVKQYPETSQEEVYSTDIELKKQPEPVEEPKPTIFEQKPEPTEIFDRDTYVEEVKNFFLSRDDKKTELIRNFTKEHTSTGKLSIKDLSDEDLIELVHQLRSL